MAHKRSQLQGGCCRFARPWGPVKGAGRCRPARVVEYQCLCDMGICRE